MTAITTPYNVGTGPMMFLSPDYLPVLGSCGRNPTAWSYGGGGNYPRPFTSYTQRIVEASNSLGPFARRVGGGASGRVILSIFDPSSGQLAFREQPWYGFNDGNTGYVSKAEWWDKSIKVYVQLRDVHVEGHPWDVFEVAFQSLGELDQYTAQWQFENILGGILAPYLGTITGIPDFLFDGGLENWEPWFIGGSDAASNAFGESFQTLNAKLGVIIPTLYGELNPFKPAIKAAFDAHLNFVLDNETWFPEWMVGIYEGYLMGEMGMLMHMHHNTQPQVNGSFDHVPGELKNNPLFIPLPDWGKENMASSLGYGAALPTATGDEATNRANLASELDTGLRTMTPIPTSSAEWNPKNFGAFFIFGKSVNNEYNATTNQVPIEEASPNPTILPNGNFIAYDTYHFGHESYAEYQNSTHGHDSRGLINWLGNIDPQMKDGLDSFFDSSPAFHTSGALSLAGKTRQYNGGGTPSIVPMTGIQLLQKSFMAVEITPQQMKDGNPTFYQALKDNGYYAAFGVDENTLP